MLQILLITIILIGVAFAGIAIKMFLQKGGQFTKSCSSVDTGTGQKVGCVCDGGDEKKCVNYEKHHGVLKDA
ncbi:MAG: hypothetical protein KDC05_03700 [Bacteroidales bacterium]|nr:hypothetical protein [Bacteroidales bacterium]